MDRPWEVMMNFQKTLRPGTASGNRTAGKTDQLKISEAAQRFLPSNNIQQSRVPKLRNIINESARVIEECRLPELNNTAVSFCRNCACDNCSNLSMLNDTQLNNSISNSLTQAFEKFLEVQRQQFLAMLQQVSLQQVSISDASAILQQSTCNLFTSSNQLAVTECDSSEVKKRMEVVPSSSVDSDRYVVPRTCAAPPSISSSQSGVPTSTMDDIDESLDSTVAAVNTDPVMKADASPIAATSNTQDKKRTDLRRSENKSGDERQHKGCNLESEFGSFDDYLDNSFKPVRKSSFMKLRESFVVLEDVEKPDRSVSVFESELELPKKPNFKVPLIPEQKKTAVVPTVIVPCTRSGRTVKKPQAYWTTGSRVDVIENIPEDTSKKRRGNNKLKSKQNAQNNIGENHSKAVLSKKDISCQSYKLPSAPPLTEKPIVSSTSNALTVVPSGVKRGRKPKSGGSSDSTHGAKDASKNISAKRRKMENGKMQASSIDSEYAEVQSNNNKSKRKRKEIQNENTVVDSTVAKQTTLRGRGKKETGKKEPVKKESGKKAILSGNKVNSEKLTEERKDNIVYQVQKQNLRYTPGNSSSSTEPEYECYLNAELSD